jgi:flavin reductase (DIM6/NTAB) family NADH-FMN oxidoreductase RutF
MEKIKIDSGAAFLYPMSIVLVGSVVEGKANFMAVGWVSRVNINHPLFAIALGPHHTNRGIDENKEFSINIFLNVFAMGSSRYVLHEFQVNFPYPGIESGRFY